MVIGVEYDEAIATHSPSLPCGARNIWVVGALRTSEKSLMESIATYLKILVLTLTIDCYSRAEFLYTSR
jgi:hypothetical protein